MAGPERYVKLTILAKLKNPSKYATNKPPVVPRGDFAKSFGPGRQATERTIPPPSRYSQSKPNSQLSRPRTVQGHRAEETFDKSTDDDGTIANPNGNSLPNITLRHMRSVPNLLHHRESSLSTRLNSLTLNDDDASNKGCRVTSIRQFKASMSLEHEPSQNTSLRGNTRNTSAHLSTSRDI